MLILLQNEVRVVLAAHFQQSECLELFRQLGCFLLRIRHRQLGRQRTTCRFQKGLMAKCRTVFEGWGTCHGS